jgi:hypothetical protein
MRDQVAMTNSRVLSMRHLVASVKLARQAECALPFLSTDACASSAAAGIITRRVTRSVHSGRATLQGETPGGREVTI